MMPPPSPPSRKEPPPGAITGKIIRSEKFDQLPEAPVVVVRGRWNASAGVLRGSQKGGDRIGAALRIPLNFTNGDLQYKIACPIDASHTLRVQSSRSNLIFLISISPRWVTIIKQETEEGRTTGKKTVAEEKLDLTPGEWSDVRVQFLNDEITVQVDDTVARAEDPSFEIEKKVVALMVNGREISFKNLTVYSSDAN
jgi:hypothetical protein